jgi:hypothetical protein
MVNELLFSKGTCESTHAGSIEVIVPPLPLTNSLLMKRPVGWVYFKPLGAVISTERSDIVKGEELVVLEMNARCAEKEKPREK